MLQLQLLEPRCAKSDCCCESTKGFSVHSLLALRVEIDPTDSPLQLIEADVVKPLKARSGNRADPVVGDKEILLPAHEYVFAVGEVFVREVGTACSSRQGSPRRKAVPMLHVHFLARAPFFVAGLEGVFIANDFAFEVGS